MFLQRQALLCPEDTFFYIYIVKQATFGDLKVTFELPWKLFKKLSCYFLKF